MAREWSVSADRNGYVNRYEIDTAGLSVLDLNDHGVLTWMAVLLKNRTFALTSPLAKEAHDYLIRTFGIDYGSADIIRGYRADDSYFSFAQDFLNGTISVRQLSKALKLGELGEQIVIRSPKAFQRISFIGAEETDSLVWYPKRKARDEKARNEYCSTDKMSYIRGDIYVVRIIEEEMTKDDERLQ